MFVLVNHYNLIENIDNSKKEIFNELCNCMFQIGETVEKIKSPYGNSLVELLAVLQYYQDDIIFPVDEGKAIGKYLKSKGYSKQEAEFITTAIMDCFD